MDKQLFSRLSKIKALADRGFGGEKENASQLFHQLLSQHGLSLSDFEREGETEIEFHLVVKQEDTIMYGLFVQLTASLELESFVFAKHLRGDRKHTQILKGSAAKIEEFKLKWEVYGEALKEEVGATILAFYATNSLFRPRKDDAPYKKRSELSKAERKALEKMMSMERVQIQKRLKK